MNASIPKPSIRGAFKAPREDLAGRDYLRAPLYYECQGGTLIVTNRAATDGQGVSFLRGVFVATLTNSRGETVRTYRV